MSVEQSEEQYRCESTEGREEKEGFKTGKGGSSRAV